MRYISDRFDTEQRRGHMDICEHQSRAWPPRQTRAACRGAMAAAARVAAAAAARQAAQLRQNNTSTPSHVNHVITPKHEGPVCRNILEIFLPSSD